MNAAIALLLAAAATAATASAPADVDAILRGLAGVPAAQARFVETKHSALLGAPLVVKGTLAYRRPDYLERHVRAPFEERTVIDGDRLTIVDAKGGRREITIPAGPARALLESTRATLAGDRRALERHFTLQASGTPQAWQLALTPRDPALAALVTRIVFDGTHAQVTRIEVLEASGDRTTTIVTDER